MDQCKPRPDQNHIQRVLDSYLGEPLPDDVVDTALSNLLITSDPKRDSVLSFAQKADSLGYLGRSGYDLSGIFYGDGQFVEDDT